MLVPMPSAELISEVLACRTFNTTRGRQLEVQGQRLLAKGLPRSVDAATARKLYRRYLAESPFRLWTVVHKTRPEHAEQLVAELERRPSLERDFLFAMARPRGKRLDFERLKKAGRTLAKLKTFSHAALSRAQSLRVAFIAADAELVEAICTVLEPRLQEKQLEVSWFISVLAQAATPGAIALLTRLAKLKKKRGDVEVLARLLRFHADEHPDVARLVAMLEGETTKKLATSEAGDLNRSLQLTSPGWSFEVLVGTAPDVKLKAGEYSVPFAMVKASAGLPPTWEVRVQNTEGYTLFRDGKVFVNGLELPTPKRLVEALRWLDDAGATLGLTWAWAGQFVKTNLKGPERARLLAWLRRQGE